MPIATRNFAFAHARLNSDGENVRVTKASGFTPAITTPDEPDPAHCARGADMPTVARVRTDRDVDGRDVPANTLLYRLTLPENHQIDPDEAVVFATGRGRDTELRFDARAYAISDRTVEVSVEYRRPDVTKPEAKFDVDVLVFRVD